MHPQTAATRAVAWSGAVLFAAALAYFLYSYSVTFGEIAAGRIALRAIAIDVGLFSAFALHHSIFAREPVRAFVRRVASPQLERSVYVWVASLMLIGVCRLWQPVAGVIWEIPAPWTWGTLALQLAAIWWTLRSAAVIDVWDLAGVRQVSTPNLQLQTGEPSPELEGGIWEFKTEGPYGWVRHPIYVGWIAIVFSIGTMTTTRFVFAVVSTVYLVIAIPLEEGTLRGHAGAAYEDYMRRVRWRLIPGIY